MRVTRRNRLAHAKQQTAMRQDSRVFGEDAAIGMRVLSKRHKKGTDEIEQQKEQFDTMLGLMTLK